MIIVSANVLITGRCVDKGGYMYIYNMEGTVKYNLIASRGWGGGLVLLFVRFYNYVQITFLQVEDEYRDVYMYVWQICHKGSTYISVADQSQKLKPIKSQPIYNCVAVKSQSVVIK